MNPKEKYDVIIIGGGATGTGIARDLALRGLSVILLEKNDIAEGTTGRCHAMLHSGGRYVYKDQEAATECAQENEILLRIAPHITQSCGGYFVGITPEEVEYGNKFEIACKTANVWVEEMETEILLKEEPEVNSHAQRAFQVKDGYIDPFLLSYYNIMDAQKSGADFMTYTKVENLLLIDQTVVGVKCYDRIQRKTFEIRAEYTINASGPWASLLEKDLELLPENQLEISPTMGTLIVLKDRFLNHLINRLRAPADGDIFVPSHNSVILGTTSIRVEPDQLDSLLATPAELEKILSLGEHLIPTLRKHRMVRFFSGARPLIANKGSSREASRKFDLVDYEQWGISGFLTIFGGKMTTYRLMAELTADLVCKKLGIKEKCTTQTHPLPGGNEKISQQLFEKKLNVNSKTAFDMSLKWGTFYQELQNYCTNCLNSTNPIHQPRTLCECENVTEAEFQWVVENFGIRKLDDFRRRTRQGMGPCQGQFCYFKIADMQASQTSATHPEIIEELHEALQKRWRIEPSADENLKRQYKLAKYMYRLGGGI